MSDFSNFFLNPNNNQPSSMYPVIPKVLEGSRTSSRTKKRHNLQINDDKSDENVKLTRPKSSDSKLKQLNNKKRQLLRHYRQQLDILRSKLGK